MADASYQPKVYRAQGGDSLVITSSGTLTLEGRMDVSSGSSITIASGGGISLASGSSFSCATAMEIASGGSVQWASGSYFTLPVQTVTSTATQLTNFGLSLVQGTTTGPVYTIATPTAAGQWKSIVLSPTSSGVTNRAVVYSGSTGTSFNSTGANQIALNTSACAAVSMVSISTTGWRLIAVRGALSANLSNKST